MGKFYGVSASWYLGIMPHEKWMCSSVDLACMSAFFEDENHHYQESQKTASAEASSIGSILEQERERMSGRG